MESFKSDAEVFVEIEQSRGHQLNDIVPSADSSTATSDDRQSNDTIAVQM